MADSRVEVIHGAVPVRSLFRAPASRRGTRAALVAACALLAASGSARPHYLAPAFPIVFAAGGRWVERLATRRRLGWVPGVAVGVLTGGLLIWNDQSIDV